MKSASALIIGFVAPMLLLAGCGTTSNSSSSSSSSSNTSTAASNTSAQPSTSPTASKNAPLLADVSEAQEGPCIVSDQYKRGEHVIFRIQIMDPTTGKALTGSDLSGVSVVLPNNKILKAQYGTHEGSTQKFWVAHWTVPSNYPTGRVNYKVKVTGSSRKVQRLQFAVPDKDAHLSIVS